MRMKMKKKKTRIRNKAFFFIEVMVWICVEFLLFYYSKEKVLLHGF